VNTSDPGSLAMNDINQMFLSAVRASGRSLSLDHMGLERDEDGRRLDDLTKVISRSASNKQNETRRRNIERSQAESLPRNITFPYSRHASYVELCHLVKVFNPKDVYPCTVDEQNWHEGE
jgi:DNA cross-link repair 1C protein